MSSCRQGGGLLLAGNDQCTGLRNVPALAQRTYEDRDRMNHSSGKEVERLVSTFDFYCSVVQQASRALAIAQIRRGEGMVGFAEI